MKKWLDGVAAKIRSMSFAQTVAMALLLFLFVFCTVFVLKQYLSLNSYHPRDFACEANPITRTLFAGKFFDSLALTTHPFFLQTHASITPFVMMPGFVLFPSGAALLFMAMLLYFTAAVYVFLIARHVLKSDWLALLCAAVYCVYLPIQYNMLNDWRYNFLYIPIVIVTFYYYLRRDFKLFILFLTLTVLTRDEGIFVVLFYPVLELLNPLLLKRAPGLAVFEDGLKKRYVTVPLVIIVSYFALFTVAMKKVYPLISGDNLMPLFLFEKYGSSPVEVAKYMVTHLFTILGRDAFQPEKLAFFGKELFGPLLLLPLAGIQGFLLAVPSVFLYLLFDYPTTMSISSPFAVTTAGVRYLTFFISYFVISLIFGVKNLSLVIRNRKAFGIVATLLLLAVIFINLRGSPFPLPLCKI
jgi:uncharacterized membrane protein